MTFCTVVANMKQALVHHLQREHHNIWRHWLFHSSPEEILNMQYLKSPSCGKRHLWIIPFLLCSRVWIYCSLSCDQKSPLTVWRGKEMTVPPTSPTPSFHSGCQWHRQCAFVYEVRTSVPNPITHKPQRGGVVFVAVCRHDVGTESTSCNLQIGLWANFLQAYVIRILFCIWFLILFGNLLIGITSC